MLQQQVQQLPQQPMITSYYKQWSIGNGRREEQSAQEGFYHANVR
jgi:hypothetical protein